jgi:hypothetical protein
VRHTSEPQVWPEGTFSASQVEALMNDPDVIVEVLPAENTASDTPEPAAAGKVAADASEPAAKAPAGKRGPRS